LKANGRPKFRNINAQKAKGSKRRRDGSKKSPNSAVKRGV